MADLLTFGCPLYCLTGWTCVDMWTVSVCRWCSKRPATTPTTRMKTVSRSAPTEGQTFTGLGPSCLPLRSARSPYWRLLPCKYPPSWSWQWFCVAYISWGGCLIGLRSLRRHMSYPAHTDFPRDVADRAVWYCGHANKGWALMRWRNTHRCCVFLSSSCCLLYRNPHSFCTCCYTYNAACHCHMGHALYTCTHRWTYRGDRYELAMCVKKA